MNKLKVYTLQYLSDKFITVFPFLKLEFYSTDHKGNEGSGRAYLLQHNTALSVIDPDEADKIDFSFYGEKSVAEFEKMMKEKFRLNVQVFRKSADIWLQTTATDHWSLNKQNGKGQRSTLDYNIEPVDITDFDVD